MCLKLPKDDPARTGPAGAEFVLRTGFASGIPSIVTYGTRLGSSWMTMSVQGFRGARRALQIRCILQIILPKTAMDSAFPWRYEHVLHVLRSLGL